MSAAYAVVAGTRVKQREEVLHRKVVERGAGVLDVRNAGNFAGSKLCSNVRWHVAWPGRGDAALLVRTLLLAVGVVVEGVCTKVVSA